jgi:hypothetical protein
VIRGGEIYVTQPYDGWFGGLFANFCIAMVMEGLFCYFGGCCD